MLLINIQRGVGEHRSGIAKVANYDIMQFITKSVRHRQIRVMNVDVSGSGFKSPSPFIFDSAG